MPPAQLFVRYWLPVIVYALLIVSISSIPIRIQHVPFRYYDKVFHFVEYGLYVWLWYRALKGTGRFRGYGWAGISAFLICVAFGILDEFYQSYIPYRVSDLYDLAADASGSLVMISLTLLKDFFKQP